MATLPPWLAIQPTDFIQAANAGAQAGLHVAQLRQSARQDAARLAQAAAEASAQREAAAARANQAVALQQWETEQRMRHEAARLAQAQEQETLQRMGLELHRQATEKQAADSLAETARHHLKLEEASNKPDRKLTKEEVLPGVFAIRPEGSSTVHIVKPGDDPSRYRGPTLSVNIPTGDPMRDIANPQVLRGHLTDPDFLRAAGTNIPPGLRISAPSITPQGEGVKVKRKSDGKTFVYRGSRADVPTDKYEIIE